MIEVTDSRGGRQLLNPDGIVRCMEASPSGKWHGINSYIKTFDGGTIECQQSVDDVLTMIRTCRASKAANED